ncbi:glycosyltransferase [Niveibacterium microcysteis]|uniref:Glycosyltransferase n=1 Tax=Niveibacterium microcysteis TaxID=2811415 RepID=A0ABX7M2K6_9RHOO|nr:glycosyltransferase [Niveibacterium microcysteis]QSI75599.1 glycosyltransferase [Niveibacterium microcysteis]
MNEQASLVNTPAWWNEYFKSEWDRYDGGSQTRAFMLALIEGLSPAERKWLGEADRRILDWGCALGQGVDELSRAFPSAVVMGLDVAELAVARASESYPSYQFASSPERLPSANAIFCSNCLEHFEAPIEVAHRIAGMAGEFLAILVPYAEAPLSEFHLASFSETSWPSRLERLERIRIAVIDVPTSAWPSGKQLLAIYGSPECRRELLALEASEKEKSKWEAYYRDLPDHDIDAPTAEFNQQLVKAIKGLLPQGARVLEAGCGGGNQSVALARDGGFNVAVLDFSPAALNHASRQFARAGVVGELIEDDAFALRSPDYDLVFNSGVLEHYTVEEQARFLRGMASRSRKYVLVLVPNRACYWYWVWRIIKTSREGWPFGREVPTSDLSEAFYLAGLKYLGHAFMGESWTESFIRSLPDCEPATRDLLCEIHRSGVIPDFSRGYLFAALGCIQEYDPGQLSYPWRSDLFGQGPDVTEVLATLGDALAARLSADNSKRKEELAHRESVLRLGGDNSKLVSEVVELSRLLADSRIHAERIDGELQRVRSNLESVLSSREALLAQQSEAHRITLDALSEARARIGVMQAQIEDVSKWAKGLEAHPLRFFFKRNVAKVTRAAFRALPVPPALKAGLRSLYGRMRQRYQAPVAAVPAVVPTLVPQVVLPAASGRDVFVFGIIDWHFRIQRPQHIARQLARRGHRVFFVSPAFVDSQEPGFALERLDSDLPLYQVRLHAAGSPAIYGEVPSEPLLDTLQNGLARWMLETRSTATIGIVEHAFWGALAAALPNTKTVYDCMDHHEGFGGVPDGVVELERRLIREADLVVTSSAWLEHEVGARARQNITIRNAGDFDHFSVVPEKVIRDVAGRRIVGYFGAIAEWFDVDLFERLILAFPQCLFVLIGNDTVGAGRRLNRYDNVMMLGERPYTELPLHLHGFDVCLLPFKIIPLTLATNPVKVYEYLAAGKPVVATQLPEMSQFSSLVYCADSAEAFEAALREALSGEGETSELIDRRIAFAASNTWAERARVLIEATEAIPAPRVSVIVLCYNNLALTKACLASVLERSDYPNLELIVVDNASTDGTPDFLRTFANQHPSAIVILNEKNLGYAAGNNVGIHAATGDYIVLLNNDTVVTTGWVRTLVRHFERTPGIGLLGPVTNSIGNEAKIDIAYDSLEHMEGMSQCYTLAHAGRSRPMRTLAFFCVMLPRAAIDRCGVLCEDYGLGWFEDDDYCRRIEKAGFALRLAEDVFVHHEHSASFGRLPEGERRRLFERNKQIYEEKWGPWAPHEYR